MLWIEVLTLNYLGRDWRNPFIKINKIINYQIFLLQFLVIQLPSRIQQYNLTP